MKIYYFVIMNNALDVMFYNDLPSRKKNSRLPIVTVAVDREKGHIGFTVNCPKDNFSRKIGRLGKKDENGNVLIEGAIDRLNEIADEPYGTVNGPDSVHSISPFTGGLVENVFEFCVNRRIL